MCVWLCVKEFSSAVEFPWSLYFYQWNYPSGHLMLHSMSDTHIHTLRVLSECQRIICLLVSLWSEPCCWVTDVLPYVILGWHITLIWSNIKRRTCCQSKCFKVFFIRSFPVTLCFRSCRSRKKRHPATLCMQLFTQIGIAELSKCHIYPPNKTSLYYQSFTRHQGRQIIINSTLYSFAAHSFLVIKSM